MEKFAFSSRRFRLAAAVLGCGLALAAPLLSSAQDTAVLTGLYNFQGSDGDWPGRLIQGSDGNFYGTTLYGGYGYSDQYPSGSGTVYRVTATGGVTTLHAFASGDDGEQPRSLIQGSDGNFYGVTDYGGVIGYGTVFRLTPGGELVTIYGFSAASQKAVSLLQGGDGNLYGIASGSGDGTDEGSVFRLTPDGVYTTLYTFPGGSGGALPVSLVSGNDGNFYGLTQGDGNNGGTIFQVTPAGQLTTLHTFTGDSDGSLPNELTLGGDGDFYGTTSGGGSEGDGVVFRITPAGGYTILYTFSGDSNGVHPAGKLVEGADGNFYGVTSGSSEPAEYPQRLVSPRPADDPITIIPNPPIIVERIILPTVFRVTPQGAVTTLYADAAPVGQFLLASDGNFYGVEDYAEGIIFKMSVVHHPAFFANQAVLDYDVYYLSFANGNIFGYYNLLPDPNYIYHQDLGYEYVIDANDGQDGLYLYDFRSGGFFYTSPTFSFPYLYDFSLQSVVYYFPDPNNPGRYTGDTADATRYFYDFGTGQIITK